MSNRRLQTAVLFALLLAFMTPACENRAWRQARKQRSVAGYQEFIRQYPDGKHTKQAWNAIDALSYQKAYKAKTPEAFRQYLSQFPQGNFADNAKTQIKNLYRGKVDGLTPKEMAAARLKVETSLGDFVIALDPDKAPGHCRNIIYLALLGFYNGLTFHPVIKDRLIQMGDPVGDNLGGPGYMIPAEINDLKHLRGAVSMWRLPVDLNTAGSQFFICVSDLTEMDGYYTVFGQVVSGMDVVDKIAQVKASGPSDRPPFRPVEPVYVNKVEVEGMKFSW
jgi:peptidylprolyl isomerase